MVTIIAFGCGTTWQEMNARSIPDERPDAVFVVVPGHAYVFNDPWIHDGSLRGKQTRSWRLDAKAAFVVRSNGSPDLIASRNGWTREPVTNEATIPVDKIVYASGGENNDFPFAKASLVVVLVAGTFLYLLRESARGP